MQQLVLEPDLLLTGLEREKKVQSPAAVTHSCPQAFSRAIQPVGTSRGQGEGLQMCEYPLVMHQLRPLMT